MKQTNTFLAIILLVVLAGCGENKQSTDDLITVDVSKSYPKKELILQDFMDVEYIALETTDEFLTQGLVKDVGKKCLLVTNRSLSGLSCARSSVPAGHTQRDRSQCEIRFFPNLRNPVKHTLCQTSCSLPTAPHGARSPAEPARPDAADPYHDPP